jgi:hypothetical protein
VDQRGGVERLAWPLLRQLLGGQLAQLVVDQGQQLAGAAGVTSLDGVENAGHFVHRLTGAGTNSAQGMETILSRIEPASIRDRTRTRRHYRSGLE